MASYKLYVATNGNDHYEGTLVAPLKTLERAKEKAEKALQETMEDVEIILRKGTYYLGETLTLSHIKKNRSDQHLHITAHEEEHVTISGGEKLFCKWEKHTDKVWKTKVDEKAAKGFKQLYINGKRQVLARIPKQGTFSSIGKEITPWPHTVISYDPQTLPIATDFDGKGAVLHIFPGTYWGNLQWKIDCVDTEKHLIHLGKGGYQINDIMQGIDATGIDQRSKFFIENTYSGLSEAGEWYMDHEEGVLYVIPEEGVVLEEALVEVSVLQQAIAIKGTQEQPISHITLSGLRITHTDPTFLEDYEAPSLGDWSIHRGGAVFFEGAHHCTIKGCFIDQVGGNGIFINNHNKHLIITDNLIKEAGDSGVCIVGNKQMTMGTNKCYSSHIVVHNNEMCNIGVYGKQTAGVFVSVSEKNTITHNHIHHVPRAAICINDGTWGGHEVAYNDIHDTVQETGDHGPFNSWGRDRFWCLEQSHGPASHGSGNVLLDAKYTTTVHDNRFEDYKGWGIDLDDGSSNYHVYNNLCIGVGVKLREGNYRTIENNIFINCANPPGFHIGYENNEDIFRRNIIVMNTAYDNPEVDIDFEKDNAGGAIYELIGTPMQGRWLKEVDHNLFFNDVGAFNVIVHRRPLGTDTRCYTLEGWQEIGFDQHSIYADPLFADMEQKDFRLLPTSPAHQIGFVPFALDTCGTTKEWDNRYKK